MVTKLQSLDSLNMFYLYEFIVKTCDPIWEFENGTWDNLTCATSWPLMNTVCEVLCGEIYKLEGERYFKCNESDLWNVTQQSECQGINSEFLITPGNFRCEIRCPLSVCVLMGMCCSESVGWIFFL